MDLGIAGRTALVTGGDSGIGLATARLLLEEGVRVALTDLDEGALRAAAATLPGEVLLVAADLTRADDVERLRAQVLQGLGSVDVLVHAAGSTGSTGDFATIDDEGWRSTLDVDLLAAVRVVRTFIEDMKGRGWGRVVLIASEDALNAYPDDLPYVAAKAALLSLTKGLSKTYGRHGVLVNAVSPAFIETPMTDAMMDERAAAHGGTREDAVERFLREDRPGIALHRRGTVEEVASVIAFVVSERASFVNGSNYRVDAGSVGTI